jgi:hypothetical protein
MSHVISIARIELGTIRLTRRPIHRLCRSIHHRERRAQRDCAADDREPVGRHPMNKIAHGYITHNAGDGGWQEVDRCLRRRVLLYVLEVEGHDRFESIETSPCEEDGYADGSEDAVSPERVRDDGWSA